MSPESEAERNALRSAARKCNAELHEAIQANPKTPFDHLPGPIIKKHHAPIAPRFSLPLFLWTIGVLNGQFEER
ncbi:hypothetical protein [Rouxiella sp. Mn2063]|uniref:hypothetical protein n=1 Tax=Rouxiella sp. Mn2063 TaxID=3395262 RepID=UPI003BBCECB5